MAENWLRWHIGTATDPKWRTVARRAGQPLHAVLAVWATMLECASEASERGTLEGWDDEDVGAALDLDDEAVAAIREAMQGKTLDGVDLTAWAKRQPKKEDNSTGRVRAFRERRRREGSVTSPDETPRNDGETLGNARGEKRREEENPSSLRSDAPRGSAAAEPAATSVEKPIAEILFGSCLRYLTANGLAENQARPLIGKWRRDYGDGEVAAAIGEAQKGAASEPISLVTAILQQRRHTAAARARGDPSPISKSAIARNLSGGASDDHQHHRPNSSRNAPSVQLAEGDRERAAGNGIPAHGLLLPGPDEAERH